LESEKECHLEIVDGKVVRSYRVREDQAAILREAVDRTLRGDTIHAVATDFNRRIAKLRAEVERHAKARIVLPGPDAATAWKSGTLPERRALLEMLVTVIVIHPRDWRGSRVTRGSDNAVRNAA
jgi:hypothetical protein